MANTKNSWNNNMKILVFLPRFPFPLNKGDKLRAFNQIKQLAKGNEVYLFALSFKNVETEHIKQVKAFCKDVHIEKLRLFPLLLSLLKNLFTRLPLQVSLFTTDKSKKNFLHYYNYVRPDSIYFQFVRSGQYAKYIKGNDNHTPKMVLDFQDCLSMNMLRRANVSSFFVKTILMQEVKRLRKYENKMFSIFDFTTIITSQDRDCVVSSRRNEIEIVENGVEESYFSYPKNADIVFDIIFSGNMSYKPNVVAAKFLVEKIMPLVWKTFPNITVCLAGSNPTKEVLALQSDKVTVTGWVDDMKPYYAQSRIFIAPMQIGTGLQNKLLEAMAMSLPCITTTLANAALRSIHGRDVLVGDNENELAEHILSLLQDETLRQKIAESGNKFVKENYSWQTSTEKLERLLK